MTKNRFKRIGLAFLVVSSLTVASAHAGVISWIWNKASSAAVCGWYTSNGYTCPEKPWYLSWIPTASWCASTCARSAR